MFNIIPKRGMEVICREKEIKQRNNVMCKWKINWITGKETRKRRSVWNFECREEWKKWKKKGGGGREEQ